MYARIINGVFTIAPKKINRIIDGQEYTTYNPTDEMLAEQGWLPVVETEMPDDAPDGWHYEPTYTEWQTETEREILQEWALVENSDDISDGEALEIILGGGGDDED